MNFQPKKTNPISLINLLFKTPLSRNKSILIIIFSSLRVLMDVETDCESENITNLYLWCCEMKYMTTPNQ